MSWNQEEMCKKAITYFSEGSSINLGIGLPTMIAELLPKDHDFMIHSENGLLGIKGRPTPSELSPTCINAGKESVVLGLGGSYFDSSLSFGMIRGGHVDFAVLGGMEVDFDGSLANWMIPGKKVTGMGGAMDLVHGAKTVIVMMKEFNKKGERKLRKKCSLPLTGHGVVDLVITDHGVYRPGNGELQTLETP